MTRHPGHTAQTAWLRRLPGSVRSVPGLEWMILRRMPHAVALATAAPLLIALLAIGLHDADTALAFERFRSDVTILLIAVLATLWTAAFTLAISCQPVVGVGDQSRLVAVSSAALVATMDERASRVVAAPCRPCELRMTMPESAINQPPSTRIAPSGLAG